VYLREFKDAKSFSNVPLSFVKGWDEVTEELITLSIERSAKVVVLLTAFGE